jgi:hypothetical protein
MKVASVEITLACNLRCGYCARPKTEVFMPEETYRAVLRDCREWGAAAVALGGGEALLHPQVGDFLRLAKEAGLVTALTTNGTVWPLPPGVGEWLDNLAVSAGKVQGWEARLRGLLVGPPAVTVNLLLLRGGLAAVKEQAPKAVAVGCRRLLFIAYKGREECYRPQQGELVNLFGLAAYLGGRGIEAAVDAYTLRQLGFLKTCTSGFRRWDVRGRQEPCCFPGCEHYAA